MGGRRSLCVAMTARILGGFWVSANGFRRARHEPIESESGSSYATPAKREALRPVVLPNIAHSHGLRSAQTCGTPWPRRDLSSADCQP